MNWITINWIVLLVQLHLIVVTKCDEFIDRTVLHPKKSTTFDSWC